jgi:hypothetical protein
MMYYGPSCVRAMARVVRVAIASGALVLGSASSQSCTTGCSFRLASRVPFPSPTNAVKVACCGAFVFQDVDLTDADIEEVDVANGQVNNGRVDAFLTTTDCTVLFAAPYDGASAQPLCRIFIGPVPPGAVSDRRKLPKGTYRLFAQAWATNESSNTFAVDVGLWTHKCRPNLTGPS